MCARWTLSVVLILNFSLNSTSQTDSCLNNRFIPDLAIHSFPAVSTTDIVYGLNTSINLARVYEPTGDVSMCRPLIIWAHGGGFYTGSYLEQKTTDMMTQLARKGYVSAALRYRLWPSNPTSNQEYQEALILGVQDMIAAIRYFKANASTFGIDTTQIFIGGSSAGAIIANHTAFMDENEAFPTALANQGNSFNVSTLPANLSYSYSIAGCVTQAGSLWDLNFLANENTPWGAVHNTTDGVVPHNSGGGSQQIYNSLQSMGMESYLKLTNSPGLHTPFPSTPSAPYVDTFNLASYQHLYAMLKHQSSAEIQIQGPDLVAVPNGTNYQWFLNGFPIAGANSSYHTPSSNGNYTVRVEFCSQCFSVSDPVTINSLNLLESDKNVFINISPNPTQNHIEIENAAFNSQFKLYDYLGRTLIQTILTDSKQQILLSELKSGSYTYQILNPSGEIQSGIIVKM
jgi:predicted esterase